LNQDKINLYFEDHSLRFCNGSPPRLVSLTVLNINGAGCLKASVDGNTKNIMNVLVFFYQFDLCVKKIVCNFK
jgi:hypothetical protein